MVRLTVRLPRDLHNKMRKYKKSRPHISFNTLIVESLYQALTDREPVLSRGIKHDEK